MRAMRLLCLLAAAAAVLSAAKPEAWVPMRWPWAEPESLALLEGSRVNCLLMDAGAITKGFLEVAKSRRVEVLAVVTSAQAGGAQAAIERGAAGLALRGEFAAADRERMRKLAPQTVEFVARVDLRFADPPAVLATEQGVWPGVNVQENDTAHAAPSGAPWIDTNSGFLRFARASAPEAMVWIGVEPPKGQAIPAQRYLQVIGDAAMMGARWVIALDGDLAARLSRREEKALKIWARINGVLSYYEDHAEWRRGRPHGQLAVVQDVANGGALSGGILDMIAVKHTPVRAVEPSRMSASSFDDCQMAVNVAVDGLTDPQKAILREFTKRGGTLLTGPPGWRMPAPKREQVTLAKEDIDKLDQIWKEVNTMTGRKNLGVRLFNVSSLLSNLTAEGQKLRLQLVNYSDYPVDSIAVHVLGTYRAARLLRPGKPPLELKPYENEDGVGVDIDLIESVATVEIE